MSAPVTMRGSAAGVPSRSGQGVLARGKTVATLCVLAVLLLSAVTLRLWAAMEAVNAW